MISNPAIDNCFHFFLLFFFLMFVTLSILAIRNTSSFFLPFFVFWNNFKLTEQSGLIQRAPINLLSRFLNCWKLIFALSFFFEVYLYVYLYMHFFSWTIWADITTEFQSHNQVTCHRLIFISKFAMTHPILMLRTVLKDQDLLFFFFFFSH